MLTNVAMTLFISSFVILVICHPKRLAMVSRDHRPVLSLWVVIIASAFITFAISRARPLAPPTCPLKTGITYFPVESTHTTAGSVCLSLTMGSIFLTQMPNAPMKTIASPSKHKFPFRILSARRLPASFIVSYFIILLSNVLCSTTQELISLSLL